MPQSIFADIGGEFDNHLLRDVAELLETRVITTAAYSPWSNGIVERHNAVLENMVLKRTDDSKCTVANALVWAVTAKNASMPNFKSIFFKMAVLQGGEQNLPSPCVCYPKDPMWNRVKGMEVVMATVAMLTWNTTNAIIRASRGLA